MDLRSSTAQGHTADPSDLGLPFFKVDEAGRVFIEAKDGYILRQKGFKLPKSRLTHVTEPGIVSPPLGIVPMGNHHKIKVEMAEDIHPLGPMQVFPHLIDLIDRESKGADCQGSSTGSDQASAALDPFREDFRNGRLSPLAHGIGRTSGSDQDKIGFS